MVKAASIYQEEDEDDDDDLGARTDGSSQKDGKRSEQKANTPRSKHSATEQRRRSKINERFQILRDLIPENDQKRDKASFLLEVIEYVQFLQEKVQMYEGSYQGWSVEPTKLIPWKNHRGPVESIMDQSQLVNNGSGHENNAVANPAMLTNAQNLIEADLCVAAAYQAIEHPPAQATQAVHPSMPVQATIISPHGTVGVTSLPLQESLSNTENAASQPQSPLWPVRPCTAEGGAVPSNAREELTSENGTDSISSAYSQGLLTTLTQALQSSGVDLSKASISVKLDVGKQANSGSNATTSSAKHTGNSPADQAVTHFGVRSFLENYDQARKRLRTENS